MKSIEIIRLNDIFKKSLDWNIQRITLLSLFITSLIKVRTLNLSKLSQTFSTESMILSNYRRIQRFLSQFEMDFNIIAKLLFSFLPKMEKYVITIDRTNWKFGELNINILFLAIAYKGIAFPIIFKLLLKAENEEQCKRGNSNTKERIELIQKFIEIFGIEKIDFVTGDREFIGETWIQWLSNIELTYTLRIRDNINIFNSKGLLQAVKLSFKHLRVNESLIISRKIFGLKLNIIGMKLENNEYLILITNYNNPDKALEMYKKRWEIETMFSAFKKRGFNLEDTKITDIKKLEKLIALLSITFCWCYIIGEWRAEIKAIKFREDINAYTRTVLNYGLEYIHNILVNLHLKMDLFYKMTDLLLLPLQRFNEFVME